MRRLRWLALAVALFVAAAWLMSGPSRPESAVVAAARDIAVPRHPTHEEFLRRNQRATIVENLPPTEADDAPTVRRYDPLLVALPPTAPGQTVLVVEANAIRYSALGERVIGCLLQRDRKEYDEVVEKLGIDPFEDIDRIGGTDQLLTISGNFERLHFEGLSTETTRPYGDHGQLVTEGSRVIGLWKNELLLISADRQQVEAAIDRLEGRAERSTAPLAEGVAYGEIYGNLSPEALLDLVPAENRARFAEKLQGAAQQIELHVNVQEDVAMVATIRGEGGEALTDLSKSLGAALALGRLSAANGGEPDLAEVLDLAKVRPPSSDHGDAELEAELVLPRALLEKHLAEVCDPAVPAAD